MSAQRLVSGVLAAAAWGAGTWLFAAAPPPAPAAAPKAAEVKTSTATAPVASVATIYPVEKLRDPFQKTSGGPAFSTKPMAPEDFNIHNLSLRGLMKDTASDYALFSDNTFGVSFILRKGRLFDERGKHVPGISGSLSLRQKTANLMTQENDVQVFRLGEEGKE